MTPEQAEALRKPFAPSQIGSLPKGGTRLDYVGHAAVTDRLLSVDPAWKWEPDRDEHGRWDVQVHGKDAVLTGTLTVCGVTRPCVGIAPSGSFELLKQLQSDAIRNGAMRFGVALDLWSKEELSPPGEQPPPRKKAAAKKAATYTEGPSGTSEPNDFLEVPVADAKGDLLAACDGDIALAKRLWGRVPDGDSVPVALLEELIAEANARPFEGES